MPVAVLHEQEEVRLLLQTGTGSEDLRRATGATELVANATIQASQAGPPVPTEGYLAVSPAPPTRR